MNTVLVKNAQSFGHGECCQHGNMPGRSNAQQKHCFLGEDFEGAAGLGLKWGPWWGLKDQGTVPQGDSADGRKVDESHSLDELPDMVVRSQPCSLGAPGRKRWRVAVPSGETPRP